MRILAVVSPVLLLPAALSLCWLPLSSAAPLAFPQSALASQLSVREQHEKQGRHQGLLSLREGTIGKASDAAGSVPVTASDEWSQGLRMPATEMDVAIVPKPSTLLGWLQRRSPYRRCLRGWCYKRSLAFRRRLAKRAEPGWCNSPWCTRLAMVVRRLHPRCRAKRWCFHRRPSPARKARKRDCLRRWCYHRQQAAASS